MVTFNIFKYFLCGEVTDMLVIQADSVVLSGFHHLYGCDFSDQQNYLLNCPTSCSWHNLIEIKWDFWLSPLTNVHVFFLKKRSHAMHTGSGGAANSWKCKPNGWMVVRQLMVDLSKWNMCKIFAKQQQRIWEFSRFQCQELSCRKIASCILKKTHLLKTAVKLKHVHLLCSDPVGLIAVPHT